MNRATIFAEQCMPTEAPVYRVTDVPFERWTSEGVRGLVLDVEDTMGQRGSRELIAEHVGRIIEAREAGVEFVAISTNKPVTTREDRRTISAWGDQLDADLVLTPLSPDQGKPSPVMCYKFMERFGLDPREVGVVGDKATADIRAGFFAGVKHRAWTRPLGGNPHMGDRLVRAPFEAMLRVNAHLRLNPVVNEHAVKELEGGVNMADLLALVAEEIEPGVPDGQDMIVGFGVPDIELSEEILASIKRPAFRVALEEIKNTADKYGETPAAWLKSFLHEHGRDVADAFTWARLGLAIGLGYASQKELKPETMQKLTAGFLVLAAFLDGGDGPAARAHKDGATTQGGIDDQSIDKALAAAADVFTMVPGGLTTVTDALLTNGRDLAITGVRRPFLQRGIDTKSIMSGKVAKADKDIAQIFGAAVGNRYPVANRLLQRSATVLKLGSMAHAPFVWIEQHELKQHQENNFRKFLELAENET